MAELLNNPAARLRSVLLALREARQTTPNEHIGDWIKRIITPPATPDETNAEFHQRIVGDDEMYVYLARVHRLPQQIRDDVDLLHFDGSAFIVRLPEIEEALRDFHPRTELLHVHDKISDTALDNLGVCDALLRQYWPQPAFSETQLSWLEERLVVLVQDVGAADDLGAELHEILLDHLDDMLHAVRLHDVAGTGPLEEALQRAWGHFALRPDMATRATKSPTAHKVMDTIVYIAAMFQIASGSLAIAQATVQGLVPGSPPTVIEVRELPPTTTDIHVEVNVGHDAAVDDTEPGVDPPPDGRQQH